MEEKGQKSKISGCNWLVHKTHWQAEQEKKPPQNSQLKEELCRLEIKVFQDFDLWKIQIRKLPGTFWSKIASRKLSHATEVAMHKV